MNIDLVDRMDGRVVSGDNGQPVAITGIDVVERPRAKDVGGGMKPILEITGLAKEYLLNERDPSAGSVPLDEPVPVVQVVDLESEDHTIFLKQVSQLLDLGGDKALVDDGGDWMMRFAEDDDNSLVPALRARGAYFKLKKKNNADVAMKYGDCPFYCNIMSMPKRQAATKSVLAEIRARLKAKNAAKMGDGLGGGDSEVDSLLTA